MGKPGGVAGFAAHALLAALLAALLPSSSYAAVMYIYAPDDQAIAACTVDCEGDLYAQCSTLFTPDCQYYYTGNYTAITTCIHGKTCNWFTNPPCQVWSCGGSGGPCLPGNADTDCVGGTACSPGQTCCTTRNSACNDGDGGGCSANDFPEFPSSASDSLCQVSNARSCVFSGAEFLDDASGGGPYRYNGNAQSISQDMSAPNTICEYRYWYDCDNSQGACEELRSTGRCGYANSWMSSGEAGVGEYDGQGAGFTECCGDDSSEHVTVSQASPPPNYPGQVDGSRMCCSSASSCIYADTCYPGGMKLNSNGGGGQSCRSFVDAMSGKTYTYFCNSSLWEFNDSDGDLTDNRCDLAPCPANWVLDQSGYFCVPPPPTGTCGDGFINPGEQCDGYNWNGITGCGSFDQFTSGELRCDANCQLDTSRCYRCGNGVVEPGESCDGASWGLVSGCADLDGFSGGTLGCGNICHFNTTACIKCGDAVFDPGEECDWGASTTQDCTGFYGFTGGTLGCNSCRLDVSSCTGGAGTCGNGVLEAGEQCDWNDFGSVNSCADVDAMLSGTLSCTAACTINTTGCTKCGDSQVNVGEECDRSNLGGETCASLGFVGGTLSCHLPGEGALACMFNTTDCIGAPVCGDGIISAGEQCDASASSPIVDCRGFGFDGGNLSCAGCVYSTSGCGYGCTYFPGTGCSGPCTKLNPFDNCNNLQGNGCPACLMGYVRDFQGALQPTALVQVVGNASLNGSAQSSGFYFIAPIPVRKYDFGAYKLPYSPTILLNQSILSAEITWINFSLGYGSSMCEPDCTYTSDETCHGSCYGTNGCWFYSAGVSQVCDEQELGFRMPYGGQQVKCCTGMPSTVNKVNSTVDVDSKQVARLTRLVQYEGKLVKMIISVFR